MDELVRLGCAPELLSMKLFPDSKEITESMAMFNAVRQLEGFEQEGEEVDGIVCVGDGMSPRTAALFAFRTKGWTVFRCKIESN
jgi:hypothetical protein